jgi:DNA topoisomerase-2
MSLTLGKAKTFIPGGQVHDKDQHIRHERSVTDYQQHTLQGQIYAVPETYIGSIDREERKAFLFDPVNEKLVPSVVTLPEGIERLFLEIISNGGDNADSSRRMGVDPGGIDVNVDMERGVVKIRSGGEPIPLAPTPQSTIDEAKYVPEAIFGILLTSSNYDTKVIRMGAGKNGYGAKLANIFSKYFRVKIGDNKNGQEWEGVWTDNMSNKNFLATPGHIWNPQPVEGAPNGQWNFAGQPYKGENYVEVEYQLDFARFGYERYSDEAYYLFARHTVDFGFTCKIPVSFNGKNFDVRSLKNYAKLYWEDSKISKAITHYEWPGGKEPEGFSLLTKKQKLDFISNPKSPDHIPIVEFMCIDTPDNGTALSYVNGLMTVEGGVHVNQAYNAIGEHFLDKFNGYLKKAKKETKKKDGKKEDKPEAGAKLDMKDLNSHMSIIFNCRIPNPKYKSQSKTYLSSPKTPINIDEEELRPLGSWELFDRLTASLDAKLFKSIQKGENRSRGRIHLEKGIDANDAGKPGKSASCALYIVEGNSAASYPKKRIALTPGNKDVAGYYPIKGKFPNTLKMSPIQAANNREIRDIKTMSGLREGIEYLTASELETLRYGLFIITTDMDSDGTHIRLLLITMFRKYPGLLINGLVCYLMTFAVRLFDGKRCVMRFPLVDDYEKWDRENPNHKFRVKFYKGLGTSRDDDIKDDMTNAPLVICLYDDEAPQNIDMAFGKNNSDARKAWIAKWRDVVRTDDFMFTGTSELTKHRTITNIINKDLIDYTIDALFRAIPSEWDFIKKSQRQSLIYMLTHWKYGHSRASSMKVDRIAGSAAEMTKYHHGPKPMIDTIIRMCQSYVGSNNLNYYQQEGQMGTRDAGGSDAADARYSETMPELWLYKVINKEMVDLVPRRIVEGEEAEPHFIPMDVPIGIVNGFSGMATGHATFSPSHRLYDVIAYVYSRINGLDVKKLLPYFKGFKGEVTVEEKTGTKKVQEADPGDESTLGDMVDASIGENGEDLPVPDVDDILTRPGITISEDDDSQQNYESSYKPKKTGKLTVVTTGIYQITKVYDERTADIVVTELPVGHWIENYHKWLQGLESEGLIHSFRDNSTTDEVKFTITKFTSPKGINHRTLKLRSSFGYNNITLIDNNGYPTVYPEIEKAIDVYIVKMLDMYEVLRQHKITEFRKLYAECAWKIEFINRVIAQEIKVMKQKAAFVYEQMDLYKIPHEYYRKVKISDFSLEKISELMGEMEVHAASVSEFQAKTPNGMWSARIQDIQTYFVDAKYDIGC